MKRPFSLVSLAACLLVEPEWFIQAASIRPNDPLLRWPEPQQRYHLGQFRFSGSDVYHGIQTMDAWEITQGSSNVVVAILAGGLYPFPEFEGRLVPGYNFVINNTNTTAIGSGDDMAAVIGANANNALGGAGVDWRCRLMPVTVLNDAGLCWASWLAQGIDFAVSNGCKVIHCSGVNEPYGAPWDSMSLQLAVSNAIAQGVIVVAPTGGHNSSRIIPPASYPGVIAVGGIVMSGGRFSSNFGPKIDLVAPAEGIVIWVASPSSPNGYYLRSFGNSYAVAMRVGRLFLTGRFAARNHPGTGAPTAVPGRIRSGWR
jgi:hypothetical protein